MNAYKLIAFSAAAVLAPLTVHAQDGVPSMTARPRGPGTEARPTAPEGVRAVEGPQASVQIGSGFTDTYGLGLGARLGYTFRSGIYAGGAVTHYFGQSVQSPVMDESSHATFVGGELGYKIFKETRWEVRPYVFVGPAFVTTINELSLVRESKTRFGVQPGLLGAYHFGNLFLSAEAKWHVTPDPAGFTLLGGAGLGFR